MLKHLWNTVLYRLQQQGRKTDYAMLVLLGALCAAALQPFHFVPVIFIAIPAMFFILNKALTTKGVFFRMWLFNFGYFVTGLYWINAALLIDIRNNWWVIPWALASLPALMSFYVACAAAIWHRLAWKGAPSMIALIVLWMIAEWVRGWAFTGFPWNLWGYVWTAYLPILQSVSLFGIYGLSFLTLLAAFLPVMLYRYRTLSVQVFSGVMVTVFIILLAWGMGRLSHDTAYAPDAKMIRIVQPDIKQEVKWEKEKIRENLVRTWALTIKPTTKTPDIIVWPETTISLVDTTQVRSHEGNIRTMIPKGSYLAMGVMEVEQAPIKGQPIFFNRLSIYDSQGDRRAAYDKHHLVPFGEFLPYQDYWPVKPVAFASGSIQGGDGIHSFVIDEIPSFSPLICYEVLFSGRTVLHDKRPAWILNVTNDAWYGNTSGPYQHLALAQTRAVEEGLPLVRAANTGVSAIFDSHGRMVASLPLNTLGTIDHALPSPLEKTLFAKQGNRIFFALLSVFFVLAWYWQRRAVTKLSHVR